MEFGYYVDAVFEFVHSLSNGETHVIVIGEDDSLEGYNRACDIAYSMYYQRYEMGINGLSKEKIVIKAFSRICWDETYLFEGIRTSINQYIIPSLNDINAYRNSKRLFI